MGKGEDFLTSASPMGGGQTEDDTMFNNECDGQSSINTERQSQAVLCLAVVLVYLSSKGEDSLVRTRPIGGGKIADHILFSVPTRELIMSGNKQAINMTEKTPAPGHGGWVRQKV